MKNNINKYRITSFFLVMLLLSSIIGIVYMLKEVSSSTNELVEKLISHLSEKSAASADDPSAVIAGLTLMENQFNNTLSHLSIILTAFFTITAFVSIGIPLIERRKTEDLVAANEELQSKLEDAIETLAKKQTVFVLLMHSLYNVSELEQNNSDQPSIATLSSVTELDTTAAISKYVLGLVQYKKGHDHSLTAEERKQLLYLSAKYFKEAIDATNNDLLCGLYYYLRSLAYYEISSLPITTGFQRSIDEKEYVVKCAIENIKFAIERDESNSSYHSVLANILRESGGNYEEARSEMHRAIDLRKKQIHDCQVEQSNLVSINKLRARDYALAEYYMWLGVIEHELLEFKEAVKCKEKALNYGYDKNEMQASIIVSRFMLGERYYERCMTQMELILNEVEYSNDVEGGLDNTGYPEYFYWAKSYLGLIIIKYALSCKIHDEKMIKRGLDLLNDAAKHQDNYRNYLRLGQAYLVLVLGNAFPSKKEDYLNNGLQNLKKSLELNPNYPDTWYALYIYYKQIGKEDEAKNYWNPNEDDHNYTKASHKPEPFGKELL